MKKKSGDEYPYRVYDHFKVCKMAATAECRYPPEMELSILEAGYTITLHGVRITKKNVLERLAESQKERT